MSGRFRPGAFALAVTVVATSVSSAAGLRVAEWNMANGPNNTVDDQDLSTVLSYAGATHPVDLLAMAETDTSSAPETASVFGRTYGGTYASVVAPADGGGDRTGFVYNTATLSLVASTVVGTGTLTHPSLRAEFRPVGTTGNEDFYVYATHLQSGSTSAIKNIRVNQAAVMRADADTLGSANVIVTGDFNWQKADDVSTGVGAYRTFSAAGTGQVVDPLNRVGDWHNNAAYKDLFSEDPSTHLDDRFDMQLTSSKLLDGSGIDYTPGSYRVIGNEGTVAPGGAIAASATLPAAVVSALDDFSDHLPVLADYKYDVSGDANGDGRVTFSDFLILQVNYGGTATSAAQGDFDDNGVVNFSDFLILQANYGYALDGVSTPMTPSQAAAFAAFANAVPEPANWCVVLPVAALLRRRSRGLTRFVTA